jgi:hypothetical protein
VVSGLLKTVQFYPDTIIILESTTNGAEGDFYERWNSGISFEDFKRGRNGYVKVFYPWHAFSELRIDPASEGIGGVEDYTDQEKELADRWGLDMSQVAWMRWSIRDECEGDFDKFCEDYPFDAESAFRKSGRGRFGEAGLKYQERVASACRPVYGVMEVSERSGRVSFRPCEMNEARVVMFEDHRPGCSYLEVCDPATGDSQTSGVDPDSNAYGVFRAGYLDHQGQWHEPAVAMCCIYYQDGVRFGNWLDTDIVEEQRYRMICYYGNCVSVTETNKDRGMIEMQKTRGDVDIYRREMFNKREQVEVSAYGWETNVKTREYAVSILAKALRDAGRGEVGGGFEARCVWIVDQLKSFVTKASGRSEAARGKHDDFVLMCAIGLTLIDRATPYFEAERERWIPRDLRDRLEGGNDVGGGTYS